MLALAMNAEHAPGLGKIGALVAGMDEALVNRLDVVAQPVVARRLIAALIARQPHPLVHELDVVLEPLRGGGLMRAVLARVAHPLVLVLLVLLQSAGVASLAVELKKKL